MMQGAGNEHGAGDVPHDFALGALSVRQFFDRAGAGYDEVAVLEIDVRESLLRRLDVTALAPVDLARCQLARHTPAVNQQPGQVGNKSRALADRGKR
jgi:hypothetical protein